MGTPALRWRDRRSCSMWLLTLDARRSCATPMIGASTSPPTNRHNVRHVLGERSDSLLRIAHRLQSIRMLSSIHVIRSAFELSFQSVRATLSFANTRRRHSPDKLRNRDRFSSTTGTEQTVDSFHVDIKRQIVCDGGLSVSFSRGFEFDSDMSVNCQFCKVNWLYSDAGMRGCLRHIRIRYR